MWKCKICGTKNKESQCTKCGYDLSIDYESFPTFTKEIPFNTTPVSVLRKKYQQTRKRNAFLVPLICVFVLVVTLLLVLLHKNGVDRSNNTSLLEPIKTTNNGLWTTEPVVFTKKPENTEGVILPTELITEGVTEFFGSTFTPFSSSDILITKAPTKQPTSTPTKQPTSTPTKQPTSTPTKQPTSTPTKQPTSTPTKQPSPTPTKQPTPTPTKQPTPTPTKQPTPTPAPTPQQVTVFLDAEGVNLSQSSFTVIVGSSYGASLPTSLSRTGYSFDGWYTEPEGYNRVTSSTKVTRSSNHILYAHWTVIEYNLTFEANGGTVSESSRKVAFNTQYGNLPIPNRDYYYFDGWYTTAGGGEMVSSSTIMGNSNVTIYAHWISKESIGPVLASEVPNGSKIVSRYYSYTYTTYTTETMQSYTPNLSGWTLVSTELQQTGTGYVFYSPTGIPAGFDETSNNYQLLNHLPYTPSETATTKRTVSNILYGYCYWQWTEHPGNSNNSWYNRPIACKYAAYRTHFASILDTQEWTEKNYYGDPAPANNKYYIYKNYSTTTQTATKPSGIGNLTNCFNFYGFKYNKSTYIDYVKLFTYSREVANETSKTSETYPTGTGVSNVKEWVIYIPK